MIRPLLIVAVFAMAWTLAAGQRNLRAANLETTEEVLQVPGDRQLASCMPGSKEGEEKCMVILTKLKNSQPDKDEVKKCKDLYKVAEKLSKDIMKKPKKKAELISKAKYDAVAECAIKENGRAGDECLYTCMAIRDLGLDDREPPMERTSEPSFSMAPSATPSISMEPSMSQAPSLSCTDADLDAEEKEDITIRKWKNGVQVMPVELDDKKECKDILKDAAKWAEDKGNKAKMSPWLECSITAGDKPAGTVCPCHCQTLAKYFADDQTL